MCSRGGVPGQRYDADIGHMCGRGFRTPEHGEVVVVVVVVVVGASAHLVPGGLHGVLLDAGDHLVPGLDPEGRPPLHLGPARALVPDAVHARLAPEEAPELGLVATAAQLELLDHPDELNKLGVTKFR